MDLRCPLPPLFADIGGYWFCLRVRIASGAVGGSILPGIPDDVEDTLLCRFEVLCRLKSEPLRTGLEMGAPRPAKAFASTDSLVITPPVALSEIMLLDRLGSLVASGNGSSLWSSDADDMLWCRSSKLGEGRKSRGSPECCSSEGLLPPKEGKGILFKTGGGSRPMGSRGRGAEATGSWFSFELWIVSNWLA